MQQNRECIESIHDELFKNSKGENTGWVTKDNLKQFANNIRVPDLMKFSDCVESGKYNEVVSENDAFARNIGLRDPPSFIFYNGTTPVAIQGAQPYEAFEQIITAISNIFLFYLVYQPRTICKYTILFLLLFILQSNFLVKMQ